jgi:formate/nitrite transporter
MKRLTCTTQLIQVISNSARSDTAANMYQKHPRPDPAFNPTGVAAYQPAEVAQRIEEAGVAKSSLPFTQLLTLAILAGAFIALGAAAFTAVMAGADAGYGPARLLGGVAFSLGLVLVIVAGAELFTGNALIVMAWVDGRIVLGALLRNWLVSYLGNAIGAVAVAFLMWQSGLLDGAQGAVAQDIVTAKAALSPVSAFARGILCNMLVCLAVWLSFAGRTVADKAIAIVFPVSAFVLLGYEHSVANFYFFPAGIVAGAPVGIGAVLANLVPVTLGNIIGGAGGVALTYWLAYRRKDTE